MKRLTARLRVTSINALPLDHPFGFLIATLVCFLQFCIFSVTNSFTVFFDDMMNDASLGRPTQTELSIGSAIVMGFSPLVGFFAGFFSDVMPPKYALLLGELSGFLGLWLSSVAAHSGAQLSVTFALPFAVATGCVLAPGAAVVATWFAQRRAAAMGITFCGGGLGSLIGSPICGRLVSMYGWRTTFKFVSVIMILGAVCSFLVRKKEAEHSLHKIYRNGDSDGGGANIGITSLPQKVDETRERLSKLVKAIVTPLFALHFLCYMCVTWSFFSSLYLPVPFAMAMGVDGTVYSDAERIETMRASQVMMFYGITQAIGSVFSGILAAYFGSGVTFMVTCVFGAAASCAMAFTRAFLELSVVAAALGFAGAGMLSLSPALVAEAYSGPNLGTMMSLVFLSGTISGVAAPLVQSSLIAVTGGDYTIGFMLMSVGMSTAAIVCFCLFQLPQSEAAEERRDENLTSPPPLFQALLAE